MEYSLPLLILCLRMSLLWLILHLLRLPSSSPAPILTFLPDNLADFRIEELPPVHQRIAPLVPQSVKVLLLPGVQGLLVASAQVDAANGH